MTTTDVSSVAARRPGSRTLTVGVEEEFVLLDRADGRPALRAPEVLASLGGCPHVKPELMRYQLETVTGICDDLDQVRDELTRHRRLLAEAAAAQGCHLVASGTTPYPGPGPAALTADPRYAALAARHAALVARSGTCALHVHIGIPVRELRVQVLTRLRPYLPTLLALSANSPIARGRDTGWASRRYAEWSRWPTARPPRAWSSAAAYDAAVRRMIGTGRAVDERSVYFHARLSPRYPTVEVRVMDTCLSVADAVAIVGLVRDLAGRALAEIRDGVPVRRIGGRRILAALRRAARYGLDTTTVDPGTGRLIPHRELLDRFPGFEPPARGTGAERQRALWARAAAPAEYARLLADATLS
jgi:carboxylate-amine ligase